MTGSASHTGPVPPWGLAVAAILSVQLGSALSVQLISTVGPAGTAWLRLSMGALVLAAAAGLALLLPVLPFAFELLALRQMTPSAFGTLMALEPAIGVLLGLLVLHQKPSITQLVGILLVVLAGAAAQRGGRRRTPAAAQRGGRRRTPAAERTDAEAELDLIG